MVHTIRAMVTTARIIVAMLAGMTPAVSTAETTEDLTAVADIIEFAF
jgi:hypothetical protein